MITRVRTKPEVRIVLRAQWDPDSARLGGRRDLLPICGARADTRRTISISARERAQADVVAGSLALHANIAVF